MNAVDLINKWAAYAEASETYYTNRPFAFDAPLDFRAPTIEEQAGKYLLEFGTRGAADAYYEAEEYGLTHHSKGLQEVYDMIKSAS